MPVKKCMRNLQRGYKWGDHGHCYTGPDAKEKAIKQGQAIKAAEESRALFMSELERFIENGQKSSESEST